MGWVLNERIQRREFFSFPRFFFLWKIVIENDLSF